MYYTYGAVLESVYTGHQNFGKIGAHYLLLGDLSDLDYYM